MMKVFLDFAGYGLSLKINSQISINYLSIKITTKIKKEPKAERLAQYVNDN